MESTNNQTPARSSEEQLKAKYGGKLYRVGITVPVDDESEKEFSYYFKRPTVPSYDRYIKTAAQGIKQGVHAGRGHRRGRRASDEGHGGEPRHRDLHRQ